MYALYFCILELCCASIIRTHNGSVNSINTDATMLCMYIKQQLTFFHVYSTLNHMNSCINSQFRSDRLCLRLCRFKLQNCTLNHAVNFRGAFLPLYSPGFLPGLITAVRAWAGSTAGIAAATVAEKSAVDVLRPVQENNLVLQASKVLVDQDEIDSEGAPNVEMPADATDVSGDANTLYSEEVRPEEVTGPTVEESAVSESEVPLEEEASVGKEAQPEETDEAEEPTAEEALDVVASSQGEDGTLAGNADQATEASAVSEEEAPREAGPDETGALEEESALIGEATGHPAEADSGSDVEIIQAVEPLLTSEAPVKDAGHCVSCHASDNAGEGVAPPGGLEVEVQQVVDGDSGESMDLAEATEGVSAVDGQRKMDTLAESLTLVSAES
ncbi:retinitis pigmentosa 1-like 1 protein isoform X1 [Gadus morhua]|uniref:retinitis pigmentosa 1-like 1 protein isoform X1 n=1 Tax=Gadus morhua TaxID=8049 RepID=UPI0011B4AEE5|nr:retinitis pigmentosa 1-like 1 protein isoform X1 [Gadus morhua]